MLETFKSERDLPEIKTYISFFFFSQLPSGFQLHLVYAICATTQLSLNPHIREEMIQRGRGTRT